MMHELVAISHEWKACQSMEILSVEDLDGIDHHGITNAVTNILILKASPLLDSALISLLHNLSHPWPLY